MKRTLLVAALLLPLAAMAQNRERYSPPLAVPAPSNVIQDSTEYARVLNYQPIPGPGIARQVCSPVVASSEHSPAGAILGGLTGALVGSRFGGGHGRDAATIAGAVGGAMVGDRIGSGSTQQQCDTVYEPGPPAGYQVTYDYKGRLLTTTTANPPGEFLRVRNRITVE